MSRINHHHARYFHINEVNWCRRAFDLYLDPGLIEPDGWNVDAYGCESIVSHGRLTGRLGKQSEYIRSISS